MNVIVGTTIILAATLIIYKLLTPVTKLTKKKGPVKKKEPVQKKERRKSPPRKSIPISPSVKRNVPILSPPTQNLNPVKLLKSSVKSGGNFRTKRRTNIEPKLKF
jgi:hypothetical protein